MGLDMYLHRKTYVKSWPSTKPEDRIEILLHGNEKGIDPEKITYIIEEVGYWRKANAIHGWIVNNCADGVDDCQPIYMPKQKLIELHQLACFVFGSKHHPDAEETALEYLPPEEGFFFGSTEIGESYWEDIKLTINILREVLKSDFNECEITYQASW